MPRWPRAMRSRYATARSGSGAVSTDENSDMAGLPGTGTQAVGSRRTGSPVVVHPGAASRARSIVADLGVRARRGSRGGRGPVRTLLVAGMSGVVGWDHGAFAATV